MPNYTVTNTFRDGEISAKRYELIWRGIIERSEKNSHKNIDNDTSSVV